MQNRTLWRRIAIIAVFAAALSTLALAPVRAIASQFLQIFRVQNLVFVPVSSDRMRELDALNFDKRTLFVTKPEQINTPAAPRTVATAEEAAAATGLAVARPTLPSEPNNTTISIHDRGIYKFQVNVESARKLLELAGVNDVTLPDALGAEPITADMAPSVVTRYNGADYDFTLVQGRSPSVTLPSGVDLSQLGRAALRVLGVAPEQADALANQIDWSSTLIFPFPSDINNFRQVQIGDSQGMMVTSGASGQRHYQLYWQRGDQFYMLMGSGAMRDNDLTTKLVETAASIR